jgi:rhodanese-related sulfurtransferase
MNAPALVVNDLPARSHPWRVVLGLLLVALVPAVISVWLHPHGPTWVRTGDITVAVARAWSDVLWVDARAASAYQHAHVPGALNLSPGSWDEQVGDFVAAWSPGRRVVVYCDGHGCQASREVAQRLHDELGLKENVHVLTGGWDAWKEARK